MCAPEGAPRGEGRNWYKSSAKCCTYWPALPNYTVGGILNDASAEGQLSRHPLTAYATSVEANPRGVNVPFDYQVSYLHYRDQFGQSGRLLCPYYTSEATGVEGSGGCQIWRHRPAVCMTFFCKISSGPLGQRFWSEAKRLLLAIEERLPVWCAKELGIAPAGLLTPLSQPDRLSREPANRQTSSTNPKPVPAESWGPWRNREVEFFINCERLVASLSWPEVVAICGAEVGALGSVVHSTSVEMLSQDMPARMSLGPMQLLGTTPRGVMVSTYRTTDPRELDRRLLACLLEVDNATAEEITNIAAQRYGISLDNALIRRLAEFGILRGSPGQ